MSHLAWNPAFEDNGAGYCWHCGKTKEEHGVGAPSEPHMEPGLSTRDRLIARIVSRCPPDRIMGPRPDCHKASAAQGALWCAHQAKQRRDAGLPPLPILLRGLHGDVQHYRSILTGREELP